MVGPQHSVRSHTEPLGVKLKISLAVSPTDCRLPDWGDGKKTGNIVPVTQCRVVPAFLIPVVVGLSTLLCFKPSEYLSKVKRRRMLCSQLNRLE